MTHPPIAPPEDPALALPPAAPSSGPAMRPEPAADTGGNMGGKPQPPADTEKTQPPVSALRYDSPQDLYDAMPRLAQMTKHRPRPGEEAIAYLLRLRGSTTPEDAVTYIAFAAQPKMAIWWGYECLRQMADSLSQADLAMMEMVAIWTTYPDAANRFNAMRAALYAPVASPAIYLGLAVGWSGGPVAPNDPAPVPYYRSPQAINTAILSCLARGDLGRRSVRLARVIDHGATLFRVY